MPKSLKSLMALDEATIIFHSFEVEKTPTSPPQGKATLQCVSIK